MQDENASTQTTPSERDKEMAADFTAGGVKLGNRLAARMIDRDQLARLLAVARREGREEMARYVNNFCARSPLCSRSFE